MQTSSTSPVILAGLEDSDDILISTDTLAVWIRRPDVRHPNWFLCYYSIDRAEAAAWDTAIDNVSREHDFLPFHQICIPEFGKSSCRTIPPGSHVDHSRCPFTFHGWEFWTGCSDYGLEFHDAPLEEIIACGDPALSDLIALLPGIIDVATKQTAVLRQYYEL